MRVPRRANCPIQARNVETLKQPSLCLRLRAPYFYPDWLHGYIVHPFGHTITGYKPKNGDHSFRIIDATAKSPFLHNYSTRYVLNQAGKLLANQYYIDKETNSYEFASGEPSLDWKRKGTSLADWQIKDLADTKERFVREGFATYQDVENICFDLLSSIGGLAKNLSKRFSLIIVDECQDLSWIQLQILKAIKDKGSRIHFVGDLNQAIYEFKKAEPKNVFEFVKENGFIEMPLSDNFRSCQGIVDVCRSVVHDKNNVKGMCQSKLASPCLFVTYEKDNIHLLHQRFADFVSQKGLDVSKSAIVARGWSTVSKLRPSGNNKVKNDQMRLAAAINLWRSGDIRAIGDAMKYIGQFVAHKLFPKHAVNAREYFCPECVNSAIQWRLFLARLLDLNIKNNDISDLHQTWKDWAKNVRTCFPRIANESRPMLSRIFDRGFRRIPNLQLPGPENDIKKSSCLC